MTSTSSRFELGQILATPGALEALRDSNQSPAEFLCRHARCDWGEVGQEDWELNDLALKDGSRLLSAFLTSKSIRIWVITEAVGDDGHRAATTILLPEEY
jgi:hypothetical protein